MSGLNNPLRVIFIIMIVGGFMPSRKNNSVDIEEIKERISSILTSEQYPDWLFDLAMKIINDNIESLDKKIKQNILEGYLILITNTAAVLVNVNTENTNSRYISVLLITLLIRRYIKVRLNQDSNVKTRQEIAYLAEEFESGRARNRSRV